MQLSTEAISTLQEVRGPINYEAMKQSLAPALVAAQEQHAQLLSEEDSLRTQLDQKLSEVQAISNKVTRYMNTMDELHQATQVPQG